MQEIEAPAARPRGVTPPLGLWMLYAALVVIVALLGRVLLRLLVDGRFTPDLHFAILVGGINLALLGISMAETTRRRGERGGAPSRWALARDAGFALLVAAAMAFAQSALLAGWNAALLLLGLANMSLLGVKALWRDARPRAGLVGTAAAVGLGGAAGFGWLVLLLVVLQVSAAPALSRLAAGDEVPLHPSEREVELVSSDGQRLEGVYLAGDPGMPAVLLCHGVGDSEAALGNLAFVLRAMGFHTLRFSFRAHGESSGALGTLCGGELLDAEAALSYLCEHAAGAEVHLFGIANGGTVAVSLAAAHPEKVRGVIALAPISDYQDFAAHRLRAFGPIRGVVARAALETTRFLTGVDLAAASPAARIRPGALPRLLIFHSSDDAVVPAAQTECWLADRPAAGSVVWLEGVVHGEVLDAVLSDSDRLKKVEEFLTGKE